MRVLYCSFCVLGKRLLKDIALDDCNKTYMGAMYKTFCNETTKVCDEYYLGKCAVLGTEYNDGIDGIELLSKLSLCLSSVEYAKISEYFLNIFFFSCIDDDDDDANP